MRRASDAERDRLHQTFAALCRIESPRAASARARTGSRRSCGRSASRSRRTAPAPQAGANSGNLLARIPGAGTDSVLLCAHIDTVPPLAPIEPVVADGVLAERERRDPRRRQQGGGRGRASSSSAGSRAAPEPPPVGLEVLFTVSEENGLRGAKAFDTGRLRSGFGYVFDHASPIGDVILASPTYDRIIAEFRGRAAHAGIRPEDGRSAIAAAARAIASMRLGRLDAETTANVGTISGGTAANVVPERCMLEAEVRSVQDGRVEAVVTELVDHLHDAANVVECDLDVAVERQFGGYRTKRTAPQVQVAEAALRSCGYEPRPIVTGGGSDANAFEAAGLPCTNLANGTERNHEPGERVSVDALEGMFEVAIALLDEAASL